jgi:hypothetical protein
MDFNIGVSGGPTQFVFSHTGAALDAGLGGFAIELNGVATEKGRFLKQRYVNPPAGQRVGGRQPRHAGTDDGDVPVIKVQGFSPPGAL